MKYILPLLLLLIFSCAQTKQISKTNDFDFLEIKGDLNENPNLLWENKDIYLKAVYRMEKLVKVDNNCFEWDFTAEDARVSNNLFNYITTRWKSFNEQLEPENKEIYKNEVGIYFVRFKTAKTLVQRMTSYMYKIK